MDFAAVADAEEMKRVLIDIHGVDDAIIADAQPTAVRAFQSVMRKSSKTPAHSSIPLSKPV
jgi:7-cyano-7-deazaguanine synthase in queuosine biosynthesis